MAVTLLALRDIALCEVQIFENAFGVGPLLEKIVVLEKMVMAESGMGDDERLHRRRVLLHEIGDAGRAVDDNFVSEAAQPLAIQRFVLAEMLAEGPMLIIERHADGGIGVEHLLRRDHLDLVRIDAEPKFGQRYILASVMDSLQRRKVPIRAFVNSLHG